MSPKLILWLVFLLVSLAWFALDPQAGGRIHGTVTQAAPAANATPQLQPQIAVK